MGIIDKIKLLFNLNRLIGSEVKEIKAMNIKDGWKTTEFWGKIALQAGAIWASVGQFVPPKYALLIVGIAEVAYGGIRGALKIVQLIQAAKATQTTVTTTEPVTTVTTPA